MIELRVEGERLLLKAKANSAIFSITHRLEGRRRWLTNGGGYSVENTPHNLEVLAGLPNVIVVHATGERSKLAPRPKKPYTSLTEPFPHQVEALIKMRGQKTFALFMEQGTGKTKVALDWVGELWSLGLVTGALVVSKKGVHRQWIDSELPTHYGSPYLAAHWPFRELDKVMLNPKTAPLKILAINYDALRTPTGKQTALAFSQAHHGALVMIADESQRIKNARSMTWNAMNLLGKWSDFRAILTGTPIAKDLSDSWAQFKWLNETIIGIRYYTAFQKEYCIMGGFEGREIVGHRNVDRFKEKTEPYTYRVTKAEIGIEAKADNVWTFELTLKQRQHIQELKKELETMLDSGEIISLTNAVSTLSKMQQVSDGFILDADKKVHRLMPVESNPRANAMLEWLDSDEEEGKAVIWMRFVEDANIICEALATNKISYMEYRGKDKDREAAVKSFLTVEGARVFVANPQSAGTGLNLQGLCNRNLYYSNSFNAIDRWQSEDRTHRIGTKGIVTYTDLIGKGALDNYILRNLRKKKGLSQLVLDDIRQLLEELD